MNKIKARHLSLLMAPSNPVEAVTWRGDGHCQIIPIAMRNVMK